MSTKRAGVRARRSSCEIGSAAKPTTSPNDPSCSVIVAGESSAAPTVAKRDGDRDDARPMPRRNAIEAANQLREEIVGIQFLDDDLQERARPREIRRACSKCLHRARTNLVAPSLRIELLFG